MTKTESRNLEVKDLNSKRRGNSKVNDQANIITTSVTNSNPSSPRLRTPSNQSKSLFQYAQNTI